MDTTIKDFKDFMERLTSGKRDWRTPEEQAAFDKLTEVGEKNAENNS